MEIGGAERALLGLLSALDPQKVDIDLFINQHTGDFMPMIPDYVNVLPEIPEYSCIERPIKDIVREGHWGIALRRLWAKWKTRRYRKTLPPKLREIDASGFQMVTDAVEGAMPSLHKFGEYDLAISFLQPHNFVLHKVMAKQKLCWIHTDYSTVHVNHDKELPVWGGYDRIVSISDDCTRAFVKTFPELADKIILIENILSPDFVRQQAELQLVNGGGGFALLTIGRYCHQKNFDNIPDIYRRIIEMIKLLSIGRYCDAKNYDNVPDICARMVEQEPDIKWYIIGYGGDEAMVRRKIAEAGMEKHVILLGKQNNPYPYIKACDIYVQPSRYEGKSVTVREAQMLYKPVVITNYPTASSQVKDGVDGVIVPLDNQACADGIVRFIRDKALQERIIDYLKTHDYGNESEVKKIYKLLGI